MAGTLVYQPNRGGRWLPIAGLGIMAVFSVPFLIVMLTVDDGPPAEVAVVFMALFWLALAWNAYWWLLRIAHEVTFDGATLTWACPLRGGRLDVYDIEAISSWRVAGFALRLNGLEDEAPVLIVAAKGVLDFVGAIVAVRPDLDVRIGRLAKMADRSPGKSRLRRV